MKEKMTGRERAQPALSHQEAADCAPRRNLSGRETILPWHQQGLGPNDDVIDPWVRHHGRGWSRTRRGKLADHREETDDWWSRLDGNGAILRYWKHKSGTPEHRRLHRQGARDQWEEHKRQMLTQPPGSRSRHLLPLRRMYEAQAKGRWFCWTGVECYETAGRMSSATSVFPTSWPTTRSGQRTSSTPKPNWHAARSITWRPAACASTAAGSTAILPSTTRLLFAQDVPGADRRRTCARSPGSGARAAGHLPHRRRLPADHPDLIDAGVDCFQPLEAKAHMDIRELKTAVMGDRVS